LSKLKLNNEDILIALPFLKDIEQAGIEDLHKFGLYSLIPKNQFITMEGDSCQFFSFVLSGIIKVYKTAENGREITLYRLKKGQSCILTASCILSHKKFPAISYSEEPVEVISIPSPLFLEWISKHDFWRNYVFNLLSERLTAIISVVEEIVFRNVDVRLAQYLIKLSSGSEEIINTTHQMIAGDIGTSREVVSRLLKDFEDERILILSRGSLKIIDFPSLKKKIQKFNAM
jgi:CRP/FNR family transcriptional regulator, anaerobic regulatory protein